MVGHVELEGKWCLHVGVRRDRRELGLVRFLRINSFTFSIDLKRIVKAGIWFIGEHSRAKVFGRVTRKVHLQRRLLGRDGRMLFADEVILVEPGHPGLVVDELLIRLLLGFIPQLIYFIIVNYFARIFVHRLVTASVLGGIQLRVEEVQTNRDPGFLLHFGLFDLAIVKLLRGSKSLHFICQMCLILRLLEVAVHELADRRSPCIQIAYARLNVHLLQLWFYLWALELLLGCTHLLMRLIQLIPKIHDFVLVFSE